MEGARKSFLGQQEPAMKRSSKRSNEEKEQGERPAGEHLEGTYSMSPGGQSGENEVRATRAGGVGAFSMSCVL